MDKKYWFFICILIVGYITLAIVIWEMFNIVNAWLTEILYTNQETIDLFFAQHTLLSIVIVLYATITFLIFSLVSMKEFFSMCGSDNPFKSVIVWTLLWLPLFFYYIFKNIHKCCRCKNIDIIHVKYKNGQQFCYTCYEARFKETHTCTKCGEKKLLHSFKKDGTKYCKECYDTID